ncbi:MAG: hypothetical protein R6U25_00455, partial [Alkalispirochaeta sp.]
MRHDWRRRSADAELMDRPDADGTKLITTIRQFRAINRLVSRSRSLIRAHILRDARRRGVFRITVLD